MSVTQLCSEIRMVHTVQCIPALAAQDMCSYHGMDTLAHIGSSPIHELGRRHHRVVVGYSGKDIPVGLVRQPQDMLQALSVLDSQGDVPDEAIVLHKPT